MKIKNKKNKANYVNYKDNGNPVKIMIAAGKTVDVPSITNVSQITNFGDFGRGFFEIVKEVSPEVVQESVTNKKATSNKKKKSEDSLDKVEKEVKNYTDNEE